MVGPKSEPVNRPYRKKELIARLRGEQTLTRMRRAGLNAPGPLNIAARVHIDMAFAWAIEIGAYTIIAHDVRIIAHDAAVKRITGYTEVLPIVIGERCYIGAGAVVLPGSVIGDDTIIGAGALVRGEIPAGSVAVGIPAKVIGSVEEMRDRHLQLQAKVKCFEQQPSEGIEARELTAMRAALAQEGRIYVR